MTSRHDDVIDAVVLDAQMYALGESITYEPFERTPRAITAIVGEELAEEFMTPQGIDHRRTRTIEVATDTSGDWGGIARTELNAKEDVFRIGEVDDENVEEGWKIVDVRKRGPHSMTLGLVFSERARIQRDRLERRGR